MTSSVEIRLLTYNIHGMRSGSHAVGSVIRAARADVVVTQEAPRIRWRTRCAELARHAELVVVSGGAPAARNLMLSALRVRVRATRDMRLSVTRRQIRRGATSALLSVGGATFGVVGVHAGLTAIERARHAAEIVAFAAWLRDEGAQAVIIAGDVNAVPTAPECQPLLASYRDAWVIAPSGGEVTFPANHGRIDAVLVDDAVDVVGCGVPDLGVGVDAVKRASDHRPLLATLRVPTG